MLRVEYLGFGAIQFGFASSWLCGLGPGGTDYCGAGYRFVPGRASVKHEQGAAYQVPDVQLLFVVCPTGPQTTELLNSIFPSPSFLVI